MVGSSRYYNYDKEKIQIIIGYTFLARKCWGGLHNCELKNLMLSHAYQFVDNVLFEIGEFNMRSQMAIQKLGATLIEKKELDGQPHRIYSLKKSKFLEIFKD